jgi:hypothetical protein
MKCIVIICLLLSSFAQAQHLRPGFDPKEYQEMLRIAFRQADIPWSNLKSPSPEHAHLVYRSQEVGLKNRWDLWMTDNKTAIISIRGTTATKESWMENFYAGMIPAIGSLHLNDSTEFHYKLAKDSAAYVHAGWTLALAYMAPDIVSKVKEYYAKGIRDFIVTGHSQGGAISFLVRSYLQYREDLPKDITWKTYSSAAPKPGNMYYAYDYDYITRNGWAFRVVNARDWVPETPFSLQTTNDFNYPNPFMNVKTMLKKQNLLIRWVVGSMYNGMDRSTKKSSRKMQKLLGKRLYKFVRKSLPGYQQPVFVKGHNYMPAGVPVILYPDSTYDNQYKYDGKNIFIHHVYAPYAQLLEASY